jgi:hypothetical protein
LAVWVEKVAKTFPVFESPKNILGLLKRSFILPKVISVLSKTVLRPAWQKGTIIVC